MADDDHLAELDARYAATAQRLHELMGNVGFNLDGQLSTRWV